jgi:hypothetical protein
MTLGRMNLCIMTLVRIIFGRRILGTVIPIRLTLFRVNFGSMTLIRMPLDRIIPAE